MPHDRPDACRYVARNPVRAGLCGEPSDWPWSSYRASAGIELVQEIERAEPELRRFVAETLDEKRREPTFRGGLEGAPGHIDRERVSIVDERLTSIAQL